MPVNEDHLFQVDIYKREISPVYWEGPVFEVRRATWFMQTDSKWLPCEENMAKQIEQGYQYVKNLCFIYICMYSRNNSFWISKHKPIKSEPEEIVPQVEKEKDIGQVDEAKEAPTKPIVELKVEEEQKEYLLGPYLGQYVVYSSPTQAWLL